MTFPFDQQNFKKLLQDWDLPSAIIEAAFDNNGVVARYHKTSQSYPLGTFTPFGRLEPSQPSSHAAKHNCSDLVCTVPESRDSNFSFASHIESLHSHGLVHGLTPSEVVQFLLRFKASLQRNLDPLLPSALLLDIYACDSEVERARLDTNVIDIEHEMGVTFNWRGVQLQLPHPTEYARLTTKLHRCSTEMIFLEHVVAFQVHWAGMLRRMLEDAGATARYSSAMDVRALGDGLDAIADATVSQQHQTQCLQKRIQTQINVVSPSWHSSISHTLPMCETLCQCITAISCSTSSRKATTTLTPPSRSSPPRSHTRASTTAQR